LVPEVEITINYGNGYAVEEIIRALAGNYQIPIYSILLFIRSE